MINFIFDFDSTLVKNESLNDILEKAVNGDTKKVAEIEKITKMAMNGLISPQDSIDRRLNIATLTKSFVIEIIERTKTQITSGMKKIILNLKNNKNSNIFIISGGFMEVIIPTAEILGIEKEKVFANNFIYNKNGIVEGAEKNLLLEEQGKVKLINKLKKEKILIGKNIMIGDGYTDLETFKHGAVDSHVAFLGVVSREKVIKESKVLAHNVKELNKILKGYLV
jgi:phosphoserine phosphatase